VVDGVGFGLGFDTYVFVGHDHFWGGDYNVYAFDRVRAREFYDHSEFHAGYRMEGGHLMAEGLGRDHMKEITHHEIVVHQVTELRRVEETHNFAKRTEEHKELTRAPERRAEPGHPEANRIQTASHSPEAREHAAGPAPERTSGTTVRPVSANTHPGVSDQHGVTAHAPETHAPAPSAASTYKPPAASAKLPPAKPRTGGTNQAPSAPR
jgi:hypothetical protein